MVSSVVTSAVASSATLQGWIPIMPVTVRFQTLTLFFMIRWLTC